MLEQQGEYAKRKQFSGDRVQSPNRMQVGARVEILQPAYVAGKSGVVRSREELDDGQITERWIIEVIGEDMFLSLTATEFRLLDLW
jgi:hypothetical protein